MTPSAFLSMPRELPARLVARFWARVAKSDGCWNWTAAHQPFGYGQIRIGHLSRGVLLPAHRLSYFLHYGPVSESLHVRHKCDNPRCVNPEHLELGTRSDNMQDSIKRGRWNPKARGPKPSATCKHGHPFTPETLVIRRGQRRGCRVCQKNRNDARPRKSQPAT